MVKLVVAGDKGRMGQLIKQMALQDSLHRFDPVFGFDKNDDPAIIQQGDVVVDFTAPDATLSHLKAVQLARKAMVIGTTGFSDHQDAAIKEFAKSIPIVKSANMSMGVNVFFKVARDIAGALPDYKVHIQEAHHQHKKDKPSGTALQVGRLIEGVTHQKVIYDEPKREGEIVGDHRVIFSSPEDTLELFHHAQSRNIFALGALQAAQWIINKKPGLYSMQDVLGLKD